jgi:hypothetical protein
MEHVVQDSLKKRRFVERLLAPRLHEGFEHETCNDSWLEVPAEWVESGVTGCRARLEMDDLVLSREARNTPQELVIVLGLITMRIDQACGNSHLGVGPK